jgi:hypothetical protein
MKAPQWTKMRWAESAARFEAVALAYVDRDDLSPVELGAFNRAKELAAFCRRMANGKRAFEPGAVQ